MSEKYVIQDWVGNYPFNRFSNSPLNGPDHEFNSFDDAEDFLSETLGDLYDGDRQEYYITLKSEVNNGL